MLASLVYNFGSGRSAATAAASSAATTTASSASTCNADLPGRIGDPGDGRLPGAAAAASAAAAGTGARPVSSRGLRIGRRLSKMEHPGRARLVRGFPMAAADSRAPDRLSGCGVTPPSPSGRSIAGIAILLLLIALLAVLVALLSRVVGGWPVLVQALFYVLLVIVWIMPLKPLVRWMVTGRFRAADAAPRH